jgi:hypothetical protein
MLVRSNDRSSLSLFELMAKRPLEHESGGRLLCALPAFKKTSFFFVFPLAKTEFVC